MPAKPTVDFAFYWHEDGVGSPLLFGERKRLRNR